MKIHREINIEMDVAELKAIIDNSKANIDDNKGGGTKNTAAKRPGRPAKKKKAAIDDKPQKIDDAADDDGGGIDEGKLNKAVDYILGEK